MHSWRKTNNPLFIDFISFNRLFFQVSVDGYGWCYRQYDYANAREIFTAALSHPVCR